jgi:maltose alpha-D-glucosyltransferase/alpha-amylase
MLEWLGAGATEQRWFADKARRATDIAVRWQEPLPESPEIVLTVAEYAFESGPPSLYFVPQYRGSGGEATADPAFAGWLLDSLAGRAAIPAGMSWSHLPGADPSTIQPAPGRLLGVEQSNTSIRFDEQALIKINRRLTVGPSPEAELAAVIAKAADSSFAARTFGVLTLTGVAEEAIVVGIATEYVPNTGDAWAYLLSILTDPDDPTGEIATEIERIADVTAAMHIGLTSDPWRSDVSPEPIRPSAIEQWEADGVQAFREIERAILELEPRLKPDALRLASLLPTAAPVLREQLHGFQALRGTYRMRIHGDYHLGQLLRTPDGGDVVVDFDGEPNRPLSERRDKYAALRDGAGMLRSFAYARGTAERADESNNRSAAWLAWENHARDRFIRRYQERLSGQPIPLIPARAEDTRVALTALELEKAIYECGYELGNRPDWLWLPLSRLVRAG